MGYIENFTSHKIRGIDKAVCTCEQKIAYNYLFAWSGCSTRSGRSYALSCIQDSLNRKKDNELKRYDIDLIYHYILQSWDRYMEKKPIFSSYEDLGKVIYSEFYKGA